MYNTLIRWILAGKPNIAAQKLLAMNEASMPPNPINPLPMAMDNVQAGEDNTVQPQHNAANQPLPMAMDSNLSAEVNMMEPLHPKNPLPMAVDNVQTGEDNAILSQQNAANQPLPMAMDSIQSEEVNMMEPLNPKNPLPMAVDTENLLSKGKVSASASTGIAALLLIGGGTVHRNFNVPNDVDEKTQPRINAESKRAEQIRNTDLIIIDVIYSFCPFPRKLCDYTI